MRKIIIFTAVLMILLIEFSSLTSSNSKNYIEIPRQTHSSTKAFCTENNFCQDKIIFCENENLVGVSPITGAAIQFPKDWQDPRPREFKEKSC